MSTATPAKAAPRRDFLATLEATREGIASMIPDPAKVDRVIRLVRTAWQTDGNVQGCRPDTIIAATMKACELNLDPCGARKHCYLIPYAGECTLQISYMGMLELAHRSGCFAAIEARLVHKGDVFRHEYTPEPVFHHAPGPNGDDASVTHVYAYARLRTGSIVIEVMTRDEVEKIRRTAKSGKVWASYWGEMAKKTAIKRLLKRQPSSVELAEAIEHDNRDYDPDRPGFAEVRVGSRSKQLLGDVRKRLAPPPPEDESQEPATAPEDDSQDDDNEPFDEPGANG